MPVTVQAIYPVAEGATFDYDYYVGTHMPLVQKTFGPKGMTSATATKGVAGGPDAPPPYFAIATMTFPDQAAMGEAMAAGAQVMADIANFTNCQPQILIGEVIA